jgi:hypothetical protein
LTQIDRILKVNQLDTVSKEIVAAARNSPVIGQGLISANLPLPQRALKYLRHITPQANGLGLEKSPELREPISDISTGLRLGRNEQRVG